MPVNVVVLDACVLYPAPIRDLLLHLAAEDLYSPRWSKSIHEEWIRNLLANRPDLKKSKLQRTQKLMDDAFPEAVVRNYSGLEKKLTLPDADDNHVLAVAIKSQATTIVTFNLKDFPAKYLAPHHVKAVHPDRFILDLIRTDEQKARKAFQKQTAILTNPPMIETQVLNILGERLPSSADALKKLT
jgi:predicted nucleic acid-binding protein